MSDPILLMYAFLVGLAANGLAGSLIEWRLQRPASFIPPLFSPSHPLRSLMLSTTAGPWMLINDAIAARRDRAIGILVFLSCFVTAGFWMLATGVVLLEFASRLT